MQKNKMKLFVKFIIVLFSINLNARVLQTDSNVNPTILPDSIQNEMVNKAIQSYEDKRNLEDIQSSVSFTSEIDSLLNSNLITINKYLAKLYFCKANYLVDKYKLSNYKTTSDSIPYKVKATEILEYFDNAINKSDCENKEVYEYQKYLFLDEILEEYGRSLNEVFVNQYIEIKKLLINKGLRPQRFGPGLSFDFHSGKNEWLGIGFSFFNGYEPKFKLRGNCEDLDNFYQPENFTMGMNFLKFSYARSLNTRENDFAIRLIDMYAPIRFVPANFGIIKNQFLNYLR